MVKDMMTTVYMAMSPVMVRWHDGKRWRFDTYVTWQKKLNHG